VRYSVEQLPSLHPIIRAGVAARRYNFGSSSRAHDDVPFAPLDHAVVDNEAEHPFWRIICYATRREARRIAAARNRSIR
jgi:hypothetical protein